MIPLIPLGRYRECICDGSGILACRCGGDFCLCGTDGEECPGCDECEHAKEDVEVPNV